MKKILFTLLLSITAFVCNAQIFSKIIYLDKFDDIVKTENVKTLIIYSRRDSTFIFETKGKQPITYKVGEPLETGSADDCVNLVDDVYGHEKLYFGFKLIEPKDTTYKEKINAFIESYSELFSIVCRTITSKYTCEFKTRLVWITGNDGSRIIYSNE